MRVGSLVECINDTFNKTDKSRIRPVKGEIYTVRDFIYWRGSTGIHLDEIVNEPRTVGSFTGELYFRIERFKEVQEPMDLSELMESGHNHGE